MWRTIQKQLDIALFRADGEGLQFSSLPPAFLFFLQCPWPLFPPLFSKTSSGEMTHIDYSYPFMWINESREYLVLLCLPWKPYLYLWNEFQVLNHSSKFKFLSSVHTEVWKNNFLLERGQFLVGLSQTLENCSLPSPLSGTTLREEGRRLGSNSREISNMLLEIRCLRLFPVKPHEFVSESGTWKRSVTDPFCLWDKARKSQEMSLFRAALLSHSDARNL